MKTKILLSVIFLFLILVACAPISTPTFTSTVTPAIILTSTSSVVASNTPHTVIVTQTNVSTSTPIVYENASENCFLNIDFIPDKTTMNEVNSVWGKPKTTLPLGDFEYWDYGFTGTPFLRFKNQTLDSIGFYLKNCTLEKIIAKLKQPEIVEIKIYYSDISSSVSYIQQFHYKSLGFSYFRTCDETQDCFVFHANDLVGGKEFYSSYKVIEDSIGWNIASYVYNWHGFDVNVEKIEDKIKDRVQITPTP